MKHVPVIAFTSVGVAEVVDAVLPDRRPGDALIRAEYSAISPGTELRCFAGLQPGDVPFPFIPGYAMIGVIEEADDPAHVGRRVFTRSPRAPSVTPQWGGQVGAAVAPVSDLIFLPEGATGPEIALAKMAAIASRGVTLTQPTRGHRVAVIGLGPIGLLSARWFEAAGADVLAVDRETARLALPSANGMRTVLAETTSAAAVRSVWPDGAEIVVDATGVAAALRDSVAAAHDVPWGLDENRGPRLVIQGSYPAEAPIPYQEAFVKELTILIPRDNTPLDHRRAVDAVAAGRIRVDDLISWQTTPRNCQEAYDRLKKDRTTMTVVFDWRGFTG